MYVECPRCNSDQGYHNGVCYECPDCDYQWSDSHDVFDFDEDEQADDEDE